MEERRMHRKYPYGSQYQIYAKVTTATRQAMGVLGSNYLVSSQGKEWRHQIYYNQDVARPKR
jgi:hypothetical protein